MDLISPHKPKSPLANSFPNEGANQCAFMGEITGEPSMCFDALMRHYELPNPNQLSLSQIEGY